jgi:hypothetical protein
MRGKPTSHERAANCDAAMERILDRCSAGTDYVFGDAPRTPEERRAGAHLLNRLMRAARRLLATADAHDPTAVDPWHRTWAFYYDRDRMEPPSPPTSTQLALTEQVSW